MPFPSTPIIDNFNRANGAPPPSANWTTGIDGSAGGISVVSNQARRETGDVSSAYWNVANFGPDVEVYATIGATIGPWRLHFRVQQEGTSGWDGYTLLAYTPTNELYLYRVDNGVQTQLGSAISQTLASGDSFGVSMIGGTITIYYKTAAGSWTALGTRNDSAYATAGKVGMSGFDALGITLDDFGGGTISAAAPLEQVGLFDPEVNSLVLFDQTLVAEGWFDEDLIEQQARGAVLLEDDFNDNFRDPAKWSLGAIAFENSAVGVDEANQQVEITPLANEASPAIYGYQSANVYDLTGREASVRIAADIGSGTEAWLVVALDTDNYLRTWVAGGTLQTRSRVTAGNSNQSHGAFDFATHAYWRIRHDEDVDEVVWEYSANGASWTELRRLARPFAIASVSVYLSGGTGASVASPAQVKFDDFNLRTPPVPTHERSVEVAAATEITVSSESFSVIERSAAVSATASVASDGHAVVERAATLSVTSTVTVVGVRVVERAVSVDAAADVSVSGEAFSIVESAAAFDATASVESSGVAFSVFEASADFTTTTTITATGTRAVERSTGLVATGSVEASAESFSTVEAEVEFTATAEISSSAHRLLERQTSLAATVTLTIAGQTEQRRSVDFSAATDINATGGIEGQAITHERSVGVSASATIGTNSQRAVQRASSFSATAYIIIADYYYGPPGIDRAAALGATATISATGTVHHPPPPRRTFMVESGRYTAVVGSGNYTYQVSEADLVEEVT